MESWGASARALWAKSGDGDQWLTLPQHMMDSAAVGRELWASWLPPGVRSHLEAQLDLQGDGAAFMAWLAGTHDVGKATVAFQGQLEDRPDLGPFGDRVRAAGLPLGGKVAKDDWYPHSTASEQIISRWLRAGTTPVPPARNLQQLAEIAGAHHGLPTTNPQHRSATRSGLRQQGEAWEKVQDELLDGMTAMTGAHDVLARVVRRSVPRTAQMLLTGIVIMADWIASNADYFPLSPGADVDLKERAAAGLEALKLTVPVRVPEHAGTPSDIYAQRFRWPAERTALPAQEAAVEIARGLGGPGLICLEAPMGSGKTEAALIMAEILATTAGRSGIMFAAPTQATSDALFGRVRNWAESVYDGQVASLYLGHSKNHLSKDVWDLRRSGGQVAGVGVDEESQGAVTAHQWLWGRKKGILSTLVVGTIDQVLFMALQSKHAMMRHLGLAGKVVVIDEAHAYTSYMNSYLGKALEWLGAYGVPVVLLSATLPPSIKASLIASYRKGLTGRMEDAGTTADSGTAYPVITAAGAGGITVRAVEDRSTPRRYRLETLADGDGDLRRALAPVRESGGCVLVLCNTVARAQAAYATVREMVGDDARLLHARFVAVDRMEKERELVGDLGPQASGAQGRPRRRVVVATQVVEQSLDVDFDLMITDIAPIDLLLQRCGRVHRHLRPEGGRPGWTREPTIMIRGVEDSGDGAPEFGTDHELIYDRSILLASWAQLAPRVDGTGVTLPVDIPGLVRAVYAPDTEVPEAWRESFALAVSQRAHDQEDAERRAKTFQFPSVGQTRGMAELWQEQRADVDRKSAGEAAGLAQVRDSDPTLEVVLTQRMPEGYRPLPWLVKGDDVALMSGQEPPAGMAYTLAASTVRLPHVFSRPDRFETALDELERSTDLGWRTSSALKGQLELRLDEDFSARLAGRTLFYDRTLGLIDLSRGEASPSAGGPIVPPGTPPDSDSNPTKDQP